MSGQNPRLPRQRAQRIAGRMDPPQRNSFAEPRTQGRIDPPVQHIDAVTPWSLLDHKDPARTYVFVNANPKAVCGVQWYKMLGYRVEKYEPGGVCPRGGMDDESEMGKPIMVLDAVLMSCTNERKAEIDAVGYDGSSGQQRIDGLEQQIIGQEGVDESRGLFGSHGRYIRVENATESDWQPVEGAV